MARLHLVNLAMTSKNFQKNMNMINFEKWSRSWNRSAVPIAVREKILKYVSGVKIALKAGKGEVAYAEIENMIVYVDRITKIY